MSALVPVLMVGGGVAFVAASQMSPAGAAVPRNVSSSGSPLGPMTPSQSVLTAKKNAAMRAIINQSGAGKAPAMAGGSLRPPSAHSAANPADGVSSAISNAVGQKLQVIEDYTKAAYSAMTAEAKKKGAAALNNSLKLDPPLTEDSKWSDIAAAVGATAGAAAGAYLGGPIGAKIGAVVGAYLGVKLEEFLSKHVDEIKAWFSDRWSDIKNWVSGVAGDVGDAVEDAAGAAYNAAADAAGYIGDLF